MPTTPSITQPTKVDRIKTHFQENWKYYAGATIGATLAAIAAYIVISKKTDKDEILEVIIEDPNNLPLYFTEGAARRVGRPSNMVLDLTTNRQWSSQGAAARAIGASDVHMSQHLNGKKDHLNGHRFKRIGRLSI